MINKTVTSVLEGKSAQKKPSCATLETYNETTIFIPVDIMEEAFESVAHRLSGISGPGGTEYEAIQGWILKFMEDSTRLHTTMENFVDQLANGSPPWADYRTFMSDRLIMPEKNLVCIRLEQGKPGEIFLQDHAKGHRTRGNHGMLG